MRKLLNQLVRLAHAKPELRGDLLPLIKSSATKLTPKQRKEAERLLWKDTHRDYKGKVDGKKSVLVLDKGRTVSSPIKSLSDEKVLKLLRSNSREKVLKMASTGRIAADFAATLRSLKVGDEVLVDSTELRKPREVKITRIEEKEVGNSQFYRAYTTGGRTRGPSGGELLDKGRGKVTFQASMRQQTGYVTKLEKL